MVYNKYPTSFKTYEEFEKIFDSIPEEDRLKWAENLDQEQLRIKNDKAWTVAYRLAGSGILPKKLITKELIRIKNCNNWLVAHALAWSGTLPKELITEELLFLKNDEGMTVAHWLAKSGTLPEELIFSPEQGITEKLFRITNDNGKTVATYHYNYLFINNRWDLLTPMLLDVLYEDTTPMIYVVTKDLSGLNDVKLEEALSVMPGETRVKLLSDIKNPDLLERIRKCIDRETENEIFEMSPDGDNTDPASGGQEELYGAERGK